MDKITTVSEQLLISLRKEFIIKSKSGFYNCAL